MARSDEDLEYRGPLVPVPDVAPAKRSTADEREFSTLKAVHRTMREFLRELKGFNAFDLKATEMSIKQQIKAHQLAYDMIEPLCQTVGEAIATVDASYREK